MDWLLTTLERQETNFNRRMDKQDGLIERILEQAKLTNGRVTELEAEHRVDEERRAQQRGRTVTRRFWITTGIALGAGGVGALVGEAARLLFG